MKKLLVALFLLPALAFSSGNKSKKFLVTITNLTKGQVMTMPVIALHGRNVKIFEVGKTASAGLTILAEDGGTDTIEDELRSQGRSRVDTYVTGNDNILPGKSVQVIIKTKSADKLRLTLVSMLASTNDTFVAAQSVKLPRGFKEVDLISYDAGTEFNSESCATIPGPPCGSHDAREVTGSEGMVTESNGLSGNGDLDLELYGFSNPAAKITIKVVK